jgi:hypothetical protein
MFSPLYDLVKNDVAVQAVLGTPVRLYAFGDAAQDGAKPYAVQQTVGGRPENCLAGVPDMDSIIVQVDAYAPAMTQAKAIVVALAAVIEPVAYITSWNGEFRDTENKLWRISFTVEFKNPR